MSVKKQENEFDSVVIAPGAEVFLSITIGNAQIGGTRVRWKGTSDNLGKGKIENLSLGKGSNCQNRTLELYTNIVDVNPSTNGVVITYYFHNADPVTVTYHDAVDNHGDFFSFITYVNFS